MKSFKEFTTTDEAMTVQQRLKRSRQFKKIKAKIAMGRKKAARKIASPENLKKRALKKARLKFFKKITNGQAPQQVSLARRNEIEKKLDKMKPKIQKFARKILPQVRKDELAKKKKSKENNSIPVVPLFPGKSNMSFDS